MFSQEKPVYSTTPGCFLDVSDDQILGATFVRSSLDLKSGPLRISRSEPQEGVKIA